MAAERRLAAIVFTDIAGYTALSQQDEPAALRLLQEQERLVQGLLQIHRGRKVKSIGDGLLLEFPDVLDAVECSVDLQRHLHDRNARSGAPPLRLRIGIHLGDVEGVGTDILGDAVNIASRIEPLADPGGICLSEPVAGQVQNKVAYALEGLGPKPLKGVREPIAIYRVALPWLREVTPIKESTLPRVAILPLANISSDRENEYFADGLTEEMIAVLSEVKGLQVISRTSVNQYKGTTKSVAQIGRELGVGTVLEGSVRKAGDRLRITVQLIDAPTDNHRWAKTYDRKMDDVFAIQAEVAERTAAALKVELLTSERETLQEKPTSNMAAYEWYLRGIHSNQRFLSSTDEASDRQTAKCFEAAIREDPKFSAAYAYLANHLIGALGLTRAGRELAPQVRDLVATALELNPNSPDGHTASGNLAMQVDLDWDRAESEFRRAIGLNPSSSPAHFWYGILLDALQRFPAAEEQELAAIQLDPLWLSPRVTLAASQVHRGDPRTAVANLEKLRENFGDAPSFRTALAYRYAYDGRADEALAQVERMADDAGISLHIYRAQILALLGRPEELRQMIAKWERRQLEGYLADADVAWGYALFGENERALALLERDVHEGDRTLWNAYQSFPFDSLRDDPRFVALLREMKLPLGLRRPRWSPKTSQST